MLLFFLFCGILKLNSGESRRLLKTQDQCRDDLNDPVE